MQTDSPAFPTSTVIMTIKKDHRTTQKQIKRVNTIKTGIKSKSREVKRGKNAAEKIMNNKTMKTVEAHFNTKLIGNRWVFIAF